MLKICCYVQAPSVFPPPPSGWLLAEVIHASTQLGRNAALGMQEEMLIFWLELCLGHFPTPVQQDAIASMLGSYQFLAVETTKPQSWSTKFWVIWKCPLWSNPFCQSCCNAGQSSTKCLKCVNSPTWTQLHDKISQRRSHTPSTARTKTCLLDKQESFKYIHI